MLNRLKPQPERFKRGFASGLSVLGIPGCLFCLQSYPALTATKSSPLLFFDRWRIAGKQEPLGILQGSCGVWLDESRDKQVRITSDMQGARKHV